ncbi:10770_t:CDS:2 [Gigaspora rosea]|nr:10770_t:CDS:2 [Gigaspora rosea]
MNQQSKNNAFLEQFHIEFFPWVEEFEIYNSVISSDSCKAFSVKYNKTVILNKITFSQRYNLENFINDKNLNSTDLYGETVKELELISSIIATLHKDLTKNNLPFTLASSSSTITNSFTQASMNAYENIKIEQNFLYNLNQLFITQFNTQSVSEYTTNAIIHL